MLERVAGFIKHQPLACGLAAVTAGALLETILTSSAFYPCAADVRGPPPCGTYEQWYGNAIADRIQLAARSFVLSGASAMEVK